MNQRGAPILDYAAPPEPPRRYIRRALLVILASTSILSLLAELYGVASMQRCVTWIFCPSLVVLGVWAILDTGHGGLVTRIVNVGIVAGLAGALAYDVFRLPFVFSATLG